MLEHGRSSRARIKELLHSLVGSTDEATWPLLAGRLLPLLGERELLAVAAVLEAHHFRQHAPGGTLEAWALQAGQHHSHAEAWIGQAGAGAAASMAPVVLAGVQWRDVLDLVLANALGPARAQLARTVAQEGGQHRVELESLCERLHAGSDCGVQVR